MPSTAIGREGIMFFGCPCVWCPSVNTYFAWLDILFTYSSGRLSLPSRWGR